MLVNVNKVIRLLKSVNVLFLVVQVYCDISLFFHTIFQYSIVDYDNPSSETYIRPTIYRFNLIISSLMFSTLLFVAPTILYLKFKDWGQKDHDEDEKTNVKIGLSPASSLTPLGLAHILFMLYIETDDKDIGENVYLRELCLIIACLTILMSFVKILTQVILLVSKLGKYYKVIVLILKVF